MYDEPSVSPFSSAPPSKLHLSSPSEPKLNIELCTWPVWPRLRRETRWGLRLRPAGSGFVRTRQLGPSWPASQNTSASFPRLAETGGRPALDLALA